MTIRTHANPLASLENLARASAHEIFRAADEFGDHIVDDVNRVTDAIEQGGLVAGAVEVFDVTSPGHVLAHGVDALSGRGPWASGTKEALSAAVNAFAAHPAFLKDLVDLAAAPSTSSTPASAHAVARPGDGPSAMRGYGPAPSTARCRHEVRRQLTVDVADIAGLSERIRGVTANDLARAHLPHLGGASPSVDVVAVVVVVDALALCPHVLEDPALMPFIGEARAMDDVVAAPPPAHANALGAGLDLAALLGQIAGPVGLGLQSLGGLLSNPLVANVLAPLLVQGLNLLVPGLGLAVAPVLPFALPLVGRLLSGGGGTLAAGASDIEGVVDAVGAFAGAGALGLDLPLAA